MPSIANKIMNMLHSTACQLCLVCGDNALARNYSVFTCGPCKAFFKRNAHKIKILSCLFGNHCTITKMTRKRCKACRLAKCYSVGMKKEMILSDNETKSAKHLAEHNTMNKYHQVDKLDENSIISSHIPLDEIFDSLSTHHAQLSCPPLSDDNLDKIIADGEDGNNDMLDLDIDFVIGEPDENFDSHQWSVSLPIGRQPSRAPHLFTELEVYRMRELLEATKNMMTMSMSLPMSPNTRIVPTLEDALLIVAMRWDRAIRNLVRTVKLLSPFKRVCELDQINLIKFTSAQIIFMRSAILYDTHTECFSLCLNENETALVNISLYKTLSVNVYESFKQFLTRMSHQLDCDFTLLHLLLAILLFNSDCPNLVNRELINNERMAYIQLLNRYLLIKYRSESESMERLCQLMQTLDLLDEVCEQHIRSYVDIPPVANTFVQQSPLIKEIYDK